MIYPFRKAFALFQQKHPDLKFSFSFFFLSKPEEVIENSKIAQRVCVCDIHANMRMSLLPLLESQAVEISQPFDPIEYLICNEPTVDCFENNCINCMDDKFLITKINRDLEFPISWQKWETDNRSKFQRINKVPIEGDASTLCDWVCLQRKKYTSHVFIQRQQSNYMIDRTIISLDLAIIQMDSVVK